MGFKPGQPKIGGRVAGTPNRLNADVKAMILGALKRGGGENWLLAQMSANPVAFMQLIGKVLPLQVTGEGGGALVIRWERENEPPLIEGKAEEPDGN